jgi:hypothetical protein
MTTQPKALWIADVIDNDMRQAAHHEEAAIELRRLHAINMSLLDALKEAEFVMSECQVSQPLLVALHRARAVIARTEGEKT